MKISYLILPLLGFAMLSCGNVENKKPQKEEKGWNEAEKALMKEHLNNNVLPYITLEGATWNWDEEFESVTYRKENSNEDEYETFVAKINSYKGFELLEEEQFSLLYSYELKNDVLNECLIYNITLQETTFYCDVYYDVDEPEWNQAEVDELISLISSNSTTTLPRPNFEFRAFRCVLIEANFGGYISLFTDVDKTDAYGDLLMENGFTFEVIEEVGFFIPEDQSFAVELAYDEQLGSTDIFVEVIE